MLFRSQGGSARYLDLEPLSKMLRQTINLLKQGQTPGQLGLGEDARQPGCESLIMLLYLQWCRAGTLRTENRAATEDPAEVCFGIADAFKMLGGDNRTKQEIEFNARDKWEMDNLGFSMRLSNTAKQAAVKKTEAWQILNQSNSGFMCMLREPSGVMRMLHNQLLGIRRFNEGPRLGTIQCNGFASMAAAKHSAACAFSPARPNRSRCGRRISTCPRGRISNWR